MNFQVIAKVEKELWKSDTNETFLYLVKQNNPKESQWSVFSKDELRIGNEYKLSGYCSMGIDKKNKDQNGKPIYKTSFNVTEAMDTIFS